MTRRTAFVSAEKMPLLAMSLFALFGLFVLVWNQQIVPEGPRGYSYGLTTASNGMELHYLRTIPTNIMLEAVHKNVTRTPYYGINGGFFYEDNLLSIAAVNDLPVNGAYATYGSGLENVKYARGTLVWDGSRMRFSVQVVRLVAELSVADRSNYWAQGGISMSLGRDAEWRDRIASENAPFAEDHRLRSAAVYDSDGNLYLVVSRTKGSLAMFREAILETVGYGRLEDGIFLDGDGSSQLRSREKELSGDDRAVVQMMRLIR